MSKIPKEHYRGSCQVCCVEGKIYLVGGSDDRRVTEYNPRTNTWRHLPSLQAEGRNNHIVCTLDNKIFALGGWSGNNFTSGEMLDLGDNNPLWRFMAYMKKGHCNGGAVVVGRKIYVLGGGATTTTTNVEVYDVDQGILMKFLQIIFDIYRSVEHCDQHANWEI